MTCYMRNLHDVFEALDLDYDKANRDRVDVAIRKTLAIPDQAHCPEVWASVKSMPRPELVERLRHALAGEGPK